MLKNFKNLLIPYVLGYTLTWYSQIWLGRSVDYEILRPTGSVMWYILALFIYRLTIEALGKIRFIVPLSILFALWAGTRPEFTTFLSSSRIVVFFPFFVAGYLWKSEYITAIRKFKGKWILVAISGVLLWAIPNYMIPNEMGIAISGESWISALRSDGSSGSDPQTADVSGIFRSCLYDACVSAGHQTAAHLCGTTYNGNLFLPLSDHDHYEWFIYPDASCNEQCMGASGSITGICTCTGNLPVDLLYTVF